MLITIWLPILKGGKYHAEDLTTDWGIIFRREISREAETFIELAQQKIN
jgi:hypothetical protein